MVKGSRFVVVYIYSGSIPTYPYPFFTLSVYFFSSSYCWGFFSLVNLLVGYLPLWGFGSFCWLNTGRVDHQGRRASFESEKERGANSLTLEI